MNQENKIELLKEMLDVEDLKPEQLLAELEEWDSIAHLSLIILLEENFGKNITGKEIRELKTIDEILTIME